MTNVNGSEVLSHLGGVRQLVELARGRLVVALTGAGLSTESGIPDYRSPEALASDRPSGEKASAMKRPRPIHGPEFLRSESVRRRYWARSALGWEQMRLAEPNAGHLALAALERNGTLVHTITQNVDRLDHKGGSRAVTELHGALSEVACLSCGAIEERDSVQRRILAANPGWISLAGRIAPDGDADLPLDRVERFEVPACLRCGGALKPCVVFFGDNVPRPVVEEAFSALEKAELLLIVGSSLAVYSGYRFLRRAVEQRTPIAIVNRGPVRGEDRATLKVEAGAGATLEALASALATTTP
jgi:NAD-dependent deacetylase sirtuin 4